VEVNGKRCGPESKARELDGRHLWHSSEFDVWSLLVSPRYLLQERIFLKISPFRVALSKFGMITPTF